jgi:hypothetical protein
MGHIKFAEFRALALSLGFEPAAPLPNVQTIAQCLNTKTKRPASTGSKANPWRALFERRMNAGVEGKAIHAPEALSDRSQHRIEHRSFLGRFLCCQPLSGTAKKRLRRRGPCGKLRSEKSMRVGQADIRPLPCEAPAWPAVDPYAATR